MIMISKNKARKKWEVLFVLFKETKAGSMDFGV